MTSARTGEFDKQCQVYLPAKNDKFSKIQLAALLVAQPVPDTLHLTAFVCIRRQSVIYGNIACVVVFAFLPFIAGGVT